MKATEAIRPVTDKLNETGVKLVEQASELTEQFREGINEAYQRGARTARVLREKAEDKTEEARLNIRQNPFRAVGIAAGAGLLFGAVVGWLIGSRRRDD
jgi:ElaB/YqjD/DUF883 family membrane-anchored ribosome-binding protein